jgi:hypothetical protein
MSPLELEFTYSVIKQDLDGVLATMNECSDGRVPVDRRHRNGVFVLECDLKHSRLLGASATSRLFGTCQLKLEIAPSPWQSYHSGGY